MNVADLVYPFAGFAVLVTLAVLGICTYVALTQTGVEMRQSPKGARLAWRVGWATILLSVAFTGALVAWAVGRTVLGGW